ncbi:MAG TPA: helix-turn-helix transcriptional regulator [Longimicrobium sp.]|nr:helix-turn-helix transcriptional regulator [Longimicrobium sp.]
MSDEPLEYEVGSDNLFADIGVPNPEEALARAKLMSRVINIIHERRLTQKRAAEILGTNQPTVSDLMRGKMHKFSLERLIAFLTALDQDVEITVRQRPAAASRPARVSVGEERAELSVVTSD